MIVCARCGAANEPSSKFCPSCGASLSTAGTKSSEAGAAPLPPLPPLGGPGAGLGAAAPAFGQPQNWPPPPLNQPAHQPPAGASAAALGNAPTGLSQAFPDQAESNARFRIGAPEGLNPFSATVSPQNAGALGQTPFTPFSSPDAPGPAPAPLPPLDPPFGANPAPFNAPGATPGFGAPPVGPSPFGPPPAVPPFGQPPAQTPFAPPPASPAFAPPQPPAPAFAPPQPPAPAFAPPQPAAPAFAQAPAPAPAYAPAQASYGSPAPPPRLDPAAEAPRGAAPAGRDPESIEAGALRVLAGFLISFEYELGQFWPLYQGQNVVGRRDAAPGLDIQIDHPTTSSRHAVIYASARPGRLKVEDVGSTNGTQLGDMQLERGRKYELRDGDTIRFGGFSLVVKLV